MPISKNSALQANDAAFQSSFQDIFKTFQTRLSTATGDAEKQSASDAATSGLRMLKEVHDKLETIIAAAFS